MTSYLRWGRSFETLIICVYTGKKDIKYFETLRKVLCYQEFFVELIASYTQLFLLNLNLKRISYFQVKS